MLLKWLKLGTNLCPQKQCQCQPPRGNKGLELQQRGNMFALVHIYLYSLVITMRRMRIHKSCHLVMMLTEADCDAYWLLPLIVIIYCQLHCYHYHFLSINVYSVCISEKTTCHYNDWYSFSLVLWFFTNPAPTWHLTCNEIPCKSWDIFTKNQLVSWSRISGSHQTVEPLLLSDSHQQRTFRK